MPEVLQRAADPHVTPRWVLICHPHDETPDLQAHTLTTRFTRRVRPFARDELPMPAQNRVGRDDRGDVGQQLSTQPLPASREPPTLRIGQPHARLGKLTPKYSVFLDQIGDNVLLFVSASRRASREQSGRMRDS
jgi:hypothetical protein